MFNMMDYGHNATLFGEQPSESMGVVFLSPWMMAAVGPGHVLLFFGVNSVTQGPSEHQQCGGPSNVVLGQVAC